MSGCEPPDQLPKQTTRREIIRKFRALGWEGPISGGKHAFMKRGSRKVHIPNPHHGQDIGAPLLKKIIEQAGIAVREWNRV